MATVDASNRANNWAAQRKQAIDKAKQTREDRKMNLAMAGEMSVANEMGSKAINRMTSSENQYRNMAPRNDYLDSKKPATMKYGMSLLDQAPSEEELLQARSSLRLLKSKMKESNGFPTMPRNPAGIPGKTKGYFEEETHEYLQHAPGDRRMGQDNNLNGVYQNDNNNYRKVFKPAFQENQYQKQTSNINHDLDDINHELARKNKNIGRNNNANNQEYASPTYADSQSTRPRGLGGKPPMTNNKYEPARDEDYSEFSNKNIPSRIPKNTLNSTKGKMGATGGSSYEDNFAAPNRQRYGMESESPTNRGYTNSTPAYDKPQNNLGNAMQKNRVPEPNSSTSATSAKVNSATKGWGSKLNNLYDDKEPEDTKAFSKPSFKKNVPAPTRQAPAYQDADELESRPVGSGNNPIPDEYDAEGPQEECPVGCGRRFNAKALEKHAKICKKVFQTKRKVFDSAGYRETEAVAELSNENKYNYPKKNQKKGAPAASGKKGGAGTAGDKNKWKQESEAFRANLRAARGGTLSKEEQANLAQANEANLTPCPHCGRTFSSNAADRHISFCASKQKLDNMKKTTKGRKI